MEISDPRLIEKRSFEIIESIIGGMGLTGPWKDVVFRVVHATADPEFAQTMACSEGAAEVGVAAIASGCDIITDVKMLLAGVSGMGATNKVHCFISDPDVAEDAARNGSTRAAAAMEKAARLGILDGSIIAVGNAPTALYKVMELIRKGAARPALVVGIPVGFVGAAESKADLMEFNGVSYITNRGRKGGSPAASAAVNALRKYK